MKILLLLACGFFLHWLFAYLWQKWQNFFIPVESNAWSENVSSQDVFSSRGVNPEDTTQDITQARHASLLIQHATRQDSFFNMVLGYIPCQVFIKDPLDHYRYKIANKNFINYYQLDEDKVLEHTDEDIFAPDVAQQLRSHDTEVCAHPGEVFRYEEDISYQRYGREVFTSLKVCFKTDDGHPYMLGVCVDITDLSHMIQREQINNEALSQVITETQFQKVVEKCTQILKSELHCSRSFFMTYSPAEKLKLFHEEFTHDMRSIREDALENHEKLLNDLLYPFENKEIITYENLSDSPVMQEFLRLYPDYPIHSLAAIPIFIQEELFGYLFISYRVPHTFKAMDKDLLHMMSNIILLTAIRDRQSSNMRRVEEENQAILDNISIPLWLYNSQGCVIQTNKAADRLFGILDSKEIFACKNLLDCDKTDVTCPIKYVLDTEETKHIRHSFHNNNYMIEASPILDQETGGIHGVVSSFYDVTELDDAIACRQAVNNCLVNLVYENDMLLAIKKSIHEICKQLGASRCYIVQFDLEDNTASCFLEYTLDREPVSDRIQKHPMSTKVDWVDCFRKEPLLSFPDKASFLENNGLESYREYLIQYDAQSIYAHRILLNGKIWGYLSATYEQTPHVLTSSEKEFISSIANCIELMLVHQEYQSKLLDALRHAESADKAKSMFLASMSHEIRTPLNAVIGYSEILKDRSLPKHQEEKYWAAIFNAANALLALINDVLDLSKLEVGQMVFTPTEVDFSQLVQDVGNIFLQKCQEKKLDFQMEISPDLPTLWIDKLRVRQILFNLVGNAVKFTDKGAITIRAHFERITEKTGTLQFVVSDTGIGISEEDQKQIFQMFVQARALRGTQAEHNGTGLGLAICKRMIDKMNGELRLNSILNQGTEFTVVLNNVPWMDAENNDTNTLPPTNTVVLESHNVLVTDDVTINLNVMTALLNKLGQNVIVANNADEALVKLESCPVDFLMTDLWMPGMNGSELATSIRRSGKFPNLVIAAVTADVEGGDNFDMSAFDAILTKPVTTDKLRQFFIDHC